MFDIVGYYFILFFHSSSQVMIGLVEIRLVNSKALLLQENKIVLLKNIHVPWEKNPTFIPWINHSEQCAKYTEPFFLWNMRIKPLFLAATSFMPCILEPTAVIFRSSQRAEHSAAKKGAAPPRGACATAAANSQEEPEVTRVKIKVTMKA